MPLDDRALAAVYEHSGFKWGSGKKYWARIEEEAQRDHASRDTDRENLLDDIGSAQWDALQLLSETLRTKRDTKALGVPEMQFFLNGWWLLTGYRDTKRLRAFRHR